MSTIVHNTATIPAAQGFELMAKNVTPHAAGQTTGGISQQKVHGAYQTASLQGLRPGTPPVSNPLSLLHRAPGLNAPSSGQATTGTVAGDPTKIHPDSALGTLWGVVGGFFAGLPGMYAGSKFGNSLDLTLTPDDPSDGPGNPPPTDGPGDPPPTDGSGDPPSGPTCDGTESDPSGGSGSGPKLDDDNPVREQN